MKRQWKKIRGRLLLTLAGLVCLASPGFMYSEELNLAQDPMFTPETVPPLTMIIVGKDERLFQELYTQFHDLDKDGVNTDGEHTYQPDKHNYHGLFDSFKCYSYNSTFEYFEPISLTGDKKCPGNWSGDWLNYMTTTRMDMIRKTLYGGKRVVDLPDKTVIERAHVPQDGHCWGRDYFNTSFYGYDITQYTPLSMPPSASYSHIIVNLTEQNLGAPPFGSNKPIMRIAVSASDTSFHDWAPTDGVGNSCDANTIAATIQDYVVRVKVCDDTFPETNCKFYPSGHHKPIGILQALGSNGRMRFGLMTGSYGASTSGGVVRRDMQDMKSEIHPFDGTFIATNGIIYSVNNLRVDDFGLITPWLYSSSCAESGHTGLVSRLPFDGECPSVGNPVAEQYEEAVRYFQAAGRMPNTAFSPTSVHETRLGLTKIDNWIDPWAGTGNPSCAEANILYMGSPKPTFDTDMVSGSPFSGYSGDLNPAVNVDTLGAAIWSTEHGSAINAYIGEVVGNADGQPTAKMVGSFGNIRGLPPNDTQLQGGYHVASLAYYANTNDMRPDQEGFQSIRTFIYTMEHNDPKIMTTNEYDPNFKVTMYPISVVVGDDNVCDAGINPTAGNYQPAAKVVDGYVYSDLAGDYKIRVKYEDLPFGSDNELDGWTEWRLKAEDASQFTITASNLMQDGSCLMRHDGVLITQGSDVANSDPTYYIRSNTATDTAYFLDLTVPLSSTTASATLSSAGGSSNEMLEYPLWYAAKWGGFHDMNENGVPDLQMEWDMDNDGVPDNFFEEPYLAEDFIQQLMMKEHHADLPEYSGSAAMLVSNRSTIGDDTYVYQTFFTSVQDAWTGRLFAFKVNSDGTIDYSGSAEKGAVWDAADQVPGADVRVILTYKPSLDVGIPFQWPSNPDSPTDAELDLVHVNHLRTNPETNIQDELGDERLAYLRGDESDEFDNGGQFRNRVTKLGTFVNSNPVYVSEPNFPYTDTWPGSSGENSAAYSTFRTNHDGRTPIVYVGSNDGMVHGFNAETGAEVLAYIPSSVIQYLDDYTSVKYSHTPTVDGSLGFGDAYFSSDTSWHTVLLASLGAGGQGISALDITDPSQFSELNADDVVLWEFTDSDDADLGFTFSRPIIARMNNGEWAAIFGNGYNNMAPDGNASATGEASLFIVSLEDGSLIAKISTDAGPASDPLGNSRNNGLGSVAALDIDDNHVVDYIYAGDVFGNLWKFDVSDGSASNWDVAFDNSGSPAPLFTAEDVNGNPQPITMRPSIVKLKTGEAPATAVQLLFATGKYIEHDDKQITGLPINSVYGLVDYHDGSSIGGRSELLEQEILADIPKSIGGYNHRLRVTSDNDYTYTNGSLDERGWYMDLRPDGVVVPTGEMAIHDMRVVGNGRVIFTTLSPALGMCDYGGFGWVYELNTYDGSRIDDTQGTFDLDDDATLTSDDLVTYSGDDVVPTAKQSDVGIVATPLLMHGSDMEYKYLLGSSGDIQVMQEFGDTEGDRQAWRQVK